MTPSEVMESGLVQPPPPMTIDFSRLEVADWENEDRMATMFGPWPNGSDSVRQQRLDFWSTTFHSVATAYSIQTVTLGHLLRWFQREGVTPRCLREVVTHLADEQQHSRPLFLPIQRLHQLDDMHAHENTRICGPAENSPSSVWRIIWRWGMNSFRSLANNHKTPASLIQSDDILIVVPVVSSLCESLLSKLTSQATLELSIPLVMINDPRLLPALSQQKISLSIADIFRFICWQDPVRHHLVRGNSGHVLGLTFSNADSLLTPNDLQRIAEVKWARNNLAPRANLLREQLNHLDQEILAKRRASSGVADPTVRQILSKRLATRRALDRIISLECNLDTILQSIAGSADNAIILSTLQTAHETLRSMNKSFASRAPPDSLDILMEEIRAAFDEQQETSCRIADLGNVDVGDASELEREYEELQMTQLVDSDDTLLRQLESLAVTPAPAVPTVYEAAENQISLKSRPAVGV